MPFRNTPGGGRPDEETAGPPPITAALDLLRQGRNEEALVAFSTILASWPSNPRALMGRALALARLGRFDEALDDASELTNLAAERGRTFSALATIKQQMGEWEEARIHFEQAIALEPGNHSHYYNFACYWAKMGDAGRVRENLAKSLAIYPEGKNFAAADADFARFRDEPWFRELVGIATEENA